MPLYYISPVKAARTSARRARVARPHVVRCVFRGVWHWQTQFEFMFLVCSQSARSEVTMHENTPVMSPKAIFSRLKYTYAPRRATRRFSAKTRLRAFHPRTSLGSINLLICEISAVSYHSECSLVKRIPLGYWIGRTISLARRNKLSVLVFEILCFHNYVRYMPALSRNRGKIYRCAIWNKLLYINFERGEDLNAAHT